MHVFHDYWWGVYLENLLIFLAALFFGWLSHKLLMRILKHIHYFFPESVITCLHARTPKASLLFLIALTLHTMSGFFVLPPAWSARVHLTLLQFFMFSIGFLLIQITRGIGDWSTHYYVGMKEKDDLKARTISTKLSVLIRITVVIIILLTAIGIAMTVPSLKNFGLSLFASAGVAGLAIGIAARSTLSNIIAGIQLALTQPIRIDDAVIVEGEFGQIEEIGNSFVVVRLWDQRRLIVPLSYFIEKPFQNWTHIKTPLIGSVMFYVDYSIPMDTIREELQKIVASTPLWDGETFVVQVTEMKELVMEVRVLASASQPDVFNLRCYIREKFIGFLQSQYPECLPRRRNETVAPPVKQQDH